MTPTKDTPLRRLIAAVCITLSLCAACAPAAADMQPHMQPASKQVACTAPTWPYGVTEVHRWWNCGHDPNIDRAGAVRVRAWLTAQVRDQLGRYLLAVYLSQLPKGCTGPADCAPMVRRVFNDRGLDGDAAVRVMMCESGGNPRASNGGRFLGLFQQMASAWSSRAARWGMAGRSVFDGYANAVVSAGMVAADGGWRQWECRP